MREGWRGEGEWKSGSERARAKGGRGRGGRERREGKGAGPPRALPCPCAAAGSRAGRGQRRGPGGWGRGASGALCDSDGDVTQMRAQPCTMLRRLTTRHPFGLCSACHHSSSLHPCRPGGGRGCAASGPGEPLTTPGEGGGALMTPHAARHTALPPPTAPSTRAPARRRQAAGCRLLRRTRRLAHVAANSMLSACGLTAAGARAAQVPREPSGWRRSEKTGQGWRLAAQAAPHLVQRLVCGHRADSLPRCDRRHARHSQHNVAANAALLWLRERCLSGVHV
jgi:hypothetical protein